jgi:hypothetical protein
MCSAFLSSLSFCLISAAHLNSAHHQSLVPQEFSTCSHKVHRYWNFVFHHQSQLLCMFVQVQCIVEKISDGFAVLWALHGFGCQLQHSCWTFHWIGMRKMPWQGCSAQNRQHAYTSKSWVRLRSLISASMSVFARYYISFLKLKTTQIRCSLVDTCLLVWTEHNHKLMFRKATEFVFLILDLMHIHRLICFASPSLWDAQLLVVICGEG